MENYLLYESAALFVIFFCLDREALEKIAKMAIAYGYFLIFPLAAPFLSSSQLGGLIITPERILLIMFLFLLLFLAVKEPRRIRISRIAGCLILLNAFTLINSLVKGFFLRNELIRFTLPLFFIILMENLRYDEGDLRKFKRVMTLLALVVFVGSVIQVTVNRDFYIGVRATHLSRDFLVAGNLYRSVSIFKSVGIYEGGMIIAYLAIFFLFLNKPRVRLKAVSLFLMMTFSLIMSFTRIFWLILVVAVMYYLWYKYRGSKKLLVFTLLPLILVAGYLFFSTSITESEIYRNRIASETYMGRVQSLDIYFQHFWGRNMLFGFGQYSIYNAEFNQFGRNTVHNGFFDLLFRTGFTGLFIYLLFVCQVAKKGLAVKRATGDAVFIPLIVSIFLLNMTAGMISFDCFAYYLLLYYLTLRHQLDVERPAELPAQDRRE
jgi:O-antigen ligase